MNDLMKILVADDSATVRNVISTVLQDVGYAVVTACDGVEAINLAYRELPDVIILDLFMPNINGYQVCRILKNDSFTASIPIIILTSARGDKNKFWSLKTGADRFLTKDFEAPDTMLDVVRECADKYRKKTPAERARKEPLNTVDILSKVSHSLDEELYESVLDKLKLQIIIRSLTEGLLTLDKEGRITAFNPEIERITGFSKSDVMNAKFREIFKEMISGEGIGPDTDISSMPDIVDAEFAINRRDGTAIPVLWSTTALNDDKGEKVGTISVAKDITKLKEIERMRADFVSMVTHELRSPLSMIKGSVDNMIDGLYGEVNSEQKEKLGVVNKMTYRLMALVNDLLDLAKLEAGTVSLNIEEIDMGGIIEQSLGGMRTLAEQKQIELTSEIAEDIPAIQADADRIEQVFVNLLSNAVKFTPDGGRVTVTARFKDGMVECVVADTGKGMPPEALDRIFDKFQQIYDRESRKKGGTGLGLAVVKNIVEAHGGAIRAESEPGRGSVFTFILPPEGPRS